MLPKVSMNLEYKKGFIHINSSPFRKIKLENLKEKPFPQRKKKVSNCSSATENSSRVKSNTSFEKGENIGF